MGWKQKVLPVGLWTAFLGASSAAVAGAVNASYDFGHKVDGRGALADCHLDSTQEECEFAQMRQIFDALEAKGRFVDVKSFAASKDEEIAIPFHDGEVLDMGHLGPKWLPAGDSGFIFGESGLFALGGGHLMGAIVDMRQAEADDGTVAIELLLNAKRDQADKVVSAYAKIQILANEDGYQIWNEYHPRRSRDWNVDFFQGQGDPTPQ